MGRAAPNVVSVRFTDDELAAMQASADRHGRTLSMHVKDMALAGELRCRPGVVVRRMDSGAELTVFPFPVDIVQGTR